jgi:predicted transcriptional regulator
MKEMFIFPSIVKDVINGMNDEYRYQILQALINNDKMLYTELKSLLQIENGSLNYHLKVLTIAGLISRFENFENRKSYYKISKLGEKMIIAMLSPFNKNNHPLSTNKKLRELSGEISISMAPKLHERSEQIKELGVNSSDNFKVILNVITMKIINRPPVIMPFPVSTIPVKSSGAELAIKKEIEIPTNE